MAWGFGNANSRYRHGFARQGQRHPLHHEWSNMITRCTNPNREQWMDYGGRGITVCNEWRHDAAAFIHWALANGWQPGLTIERIDNDGGYFPDNCTWTTRDAQNRNRRSTIKVTWNGKTQCIMDWCNELGLNHFTVYKRMKRGKQPLAALQLE